MFVIIVGFSYIYILQSSVKRIYSVVGYIKSHYSKLSANYVPVKEF